MNSERREIEGTWEEVAGHAAELAGKRVKLIVLSGGEAEADSDADGGDSPPDRPYREASGRSVLENAGAWEGNDLEECLRLAYETRSPLRF